MPQKPGWCLHIKLDPSEAGTWLNRFGAPFEPWIEEGPDGHYLRSSKLEALTDEDEVRAAGNDMLNVMNGVASLLGMRKRASGLGAVLVRADGTRHIFMRIEGAVIGFVVGEMRVSTGTTDSSPPVASNFQTMAAKAASNPLLSEALVSFGQDESWFNLYSTIETIENLFGGEKELLALRMVEPSSLKLAKRTANAHRHPPSSFEAPPKPMPFGEARELVRRLLAAAMASANGRST
ncbi:MAG: hypothetical protein ABIQ30_10115 [Devosia sp.]